MHCMNIPDASGHTTVEWDPVTDEESVTKARDIFEQIHGKGNYLAVKFDPLTKKGEQITSFDPEAKVITFITPLVGG